MNEEEYELEEDEDETQETPPLNDEELHDLAFDFLSELPMGYLGLQNDMVMIFDVKKYYYRLLDSSEQLTSNLILVKNMIQDVSKNDDDELYERIDDLPDGMKNKFSKIVFYEILLNRHLFCRTRLIAKYKNQDRILLLDGKAPCKEFINFGITASDESRKSDRFTFYLNVEKKDLNLNKKDFIIFRFIRDLSKNNKSIIAKSRNLLLNLITNTPKDHLLFIITSRNQRILYLYIKLIESIFPSNFCSYFSTKDILKKSNWLSLTSKVVNFTNKLDGAAINKNDLADGLQSLTTGEQRSIVKGSKTYNFKNRTVLIFYGSPEEVETIDNVSNNYEKKVIIPLPDDLDESWDEPEIERTFYKNRGQLVLFSYYGTSAKDDESDDNLDTDSSNEITNNDKINHVNSFDEFFLEHIKITSDKEDYIDKKELYQKYKLFAEKTGLICHEENSFFALIKKHLSFSDSAKSFADNVKNSTRDKTYFYESKSSQRQESTESSKRIFKGMRYTE